MSNGYSELDPYGNYGDKHTLSPYEMLMQMKSWNKEIYLTVEDLESRTQSQFTVQNGLIESKVSQTDFNGDTVASLISQTPTAVSIIAQSLNLSSYVTFNSLTASGTTVIDGARIQTGFISADRLQASTILAKVIAAGGISAGTITSGTIAADRLDAGVIRTKFLQAGTISADYISGGTLQGITLTVDTNATIGNQLTLGTRGAASGKIIRFSNSAVIQGVDIAGIQLSGNYIAIGGGNVDFSSATGISWGNNAPTARFA